MNRRLAAAMLLAAGLSTAGPMFAQQPGPGRNGTKPEAPPPYEDRLIDGGNLAADRAADDAAAYDAKGWPRFWRIEGVTSYYDQQGMITRELGGRLAASLDTPTYGAFTFDATARAKPGSFIATVQQRGLAFDNNWFANNALGVVTTLGIDLTRTQYRFYIPTFAALGGTTEWIHDGDVQLQASAGEPGLYDGLRLAGFQSLHGSLATAGAQWAFAPGWQAGIQVTERATMSSRFTRRTETVASMRRRRSHRSRGVARRRGCRATCSRATRTIRLPRSAPSACGSTGRPCGTATRITTVPTGWSRG